MKAKDYTNENLKCPKCENYITQVLDSRSNALGRKRRRACSECQYRFSTIEIMQDNLDEIMKELSALKRIKELVIEIQNIKG